MKQDPHANQLVSRLYHQNRSKHARSLAKQVSQQVSFNLNSQTSIGPNQILIPKIAKPKLKPLDHEASKGRSKIFSHTSPKASQINLLTHHKKVETSMGSIGKIPPPPLFSKAKSRMFSALQESIVIDQQISKMELSSQRFQTEKQENQAQEKRYLTPQDFMEILKIDQQMEQQFCYMNRKTHPYDWQIVEFEKRNPKQYMVISKRGLTKYLGNEVQFMNFQSFLSEQSLFEKLSRIQYFRIYNYYKSFQLWKKYTSVNQFRQRFKQFSERTLLVDEYIKGLLLQTRSLCKKLQQTQTFYSQTLSSMNLENFKIYVQNERIKTIKKIQEFQTLILNMSIEKIQVSMETYMKKMRISKQSKGINQKKVPLLIGDESAKDMPYTESATLRTHQIKIRNYLKLIDYLMITSKSALVVNMIEKLSHTIHEINQLYDEQKAIFNNSAWILVQMIQQNAQIVTSPSETELNSEVQQIVSGTLGQICNNHFQYLHREQFEQYWQCINSAEKTDEFIEIKSIINLNSGFNSSYLQFRNQLKKNFFFLSKQKLKYKQSLDFLSYMRQILEEDFQFKKTEFFRQVLLRIKNQMKQLAELDSEKQVGIFFIQCHNYKQTINKQFEKLNTKMHLQIPELLSKRALDIFEKAKQNYAKIQMTPISIQQYIDFLKNTKEVQLFIQQIVPSMEDNGQLLMLTESFSIKVSEPIRTNIGDSNGQMIGVKRRVDEIQKSANEMAEKFKRQIQKLVPTFSEKAKSHNQKLVIIQPLKNTDDQPKRLAKIAELSASLQIILDEKNELIRYQHELGLQESLFQELQNYERHFRQIQTLWNQKTKWDHFYTYNLQKPLSALNFPDINKYLQQLNKKLIILQRQLDPNQVVQKLKTELQNFKPLFYSVQALLNPQLKDKHLETIRELFYKNFENREFPHSQFKQNLLETMDNINYSLKFFHVLEIERFKDQIVSISVQAVKEAQLTEMITKVQSAWRNLTIVTNQYKQKDAIILGNNDQLITKIDDNILTVNNILASKYVTSIKPRVQIQSKMLRYMQQLIDQWYLHQKNWIYLQPILKSPFALKNLPKQSAMFMQIDHKWRIIMKQAKDSINIKRYADEYNSHYTLKILVNNNEVFDEVQKTLENFLEKKRDLFQRFYFLSNDELLEILSTVKSFNQIEPHLRKVFQSFIGLIMDQNGQPIGMRSPEGEEVFLKNCIFRGEVQQWFKNAQQSMKNTLKTIVRQGLTKYTEQGVKRTQWIKMFPSQIILVVDCIMWTSITQGYLENSSEGDIQQWFQTSVSQLKELVQLIRSDDLTPLLRKTLVALITQDVHFRDIIQNLEACENENDFRWLQQLKFYYANQIVYAKQVQAELLYGYQYLGATTRLVITPLTDRCWITITGALHIKLGANPAGPAGTGKTQSCKDLAKSLARYCIVFNCSDQINANMMQKLFSGLAYTGSWTCLDQFNRIDIEVLSVIAQQVLTIRQALLLGKNNKQLVLGGKLINLNHDLGIFITMNPGYAGRTQLPDNLKTLFRPISMMVPDYTLIAQIMLFSQGFTSAKQLSKKMTKLYKLSSEQLSQQDHYDFGMRAVKSVLVMAGSLKRAQPNVGEDIILIRAMQDSNVPKFLSHDLPLFKNIIEDLFPGVIIPERDRTQIIEQVTKKSKQFNIIPSQRFITKTLQLNETLKVRFGVMLVGPPLGSKTSIIKVLFQQFPIIINPKAVSLAQLYGNFDSVTQTWTDGLASKILRQSAVSHQYVLFDGPVDAIWVQNLNTVLDDSMMLCLSNGQRIKLSPQMRILFQVMDLNQASPATVSRCGMVWVPQDTIQAEEFIQGYFLQNKVIQNQEKLRHLSKLVQHSFRKCYPQAKKFCKEMVHLNQLTLIHSYCKLVKNTLKYLTPQILQMDCWKKSLEKICVYSYIWSIGAIVHEDSRSRIDKSLSQAFSPESLKSPIFNFHLNFKTKPQGEWISWVSTMSQYEFIPNLAFSQIFVPTKQTFCYSTIIQNFMNEMIPTFITGSTGTAKTSMMSQLLRNSDHSSLMFTFTAQTSPLVTQIQLQSKLVSQRRSGNITLVPPPGKKFMYFIDDINMPTVEQYGAQPPIQMLRLLLGSGGVWDRKTHSFKKVQGIQTIVAGTYGRTQLPPRFLRFFNTLYLPDLQQQSLILIFSQITKGVFRNYKIKSDVAELIQTKSIVIATLQLYSQFKRQLLPTPEKSHYLFNLRDVAKVIQGLLIAKPTGFTSPEVLVKLWVHQFQRVFEDRLINKKDRAIVRQQIAKKVAVSLKSTLTQQNLYSQPIIFCNFMKKGLQRKQMVYEETKDLKKLQKIINQYMVDETKMSLVLFEDAILHITRVVRSLIFEKGHILLIGLSGSGKKSIINLSGVIGQAVVTSIQLKKNYSRTQFREDIFRIMKIAAFQNKAVCFLFPENHMIQDAFLQDINNLLSSGQVPSMFTKENLQQITQNGGYDLFLKGVISNLHVGITLSPIGKQFRSRIRSFPSLVNCCFIDWVDVWPEEALKNVANIKLQENSIVGCCVIAHQMIQDLSQQFFDKTKRKVFVTPKSYIQLMNSFNHLLSIQKVKLQSSIGKLSNGVYKLEQAATVIADLKTKLTDLQPILQKKTVQQQQLLKKLEIDRLEASKVKQVVEVQEKQISQMTQNAMNEKKQADKILNQALPTLHAANQALNTLNRNDISQIKMNQKPHEQVKFTLQCVNVILQQKEQWEAVRKTLSDTNFISRLKNLDVHNIPTKVQTIMKTKLKTNPNFKPNQIKNISFAAKSLCEWVLAVMNFHQVNKQIVKKKSIVKKLNAQLDISNKALKQKQDQLDNIKAKVKQLEKIYLASKEEKEKLDQEIILTNKRLINAQALTQGLKTQKARWAQYLIDLNQQKKSIVGNVFLATCCVVYYGPFTGQFRDQFISNLKKKMSTMQILTLDNFQLKQIIGDNLEIEQWISYGLPKDTVSINSGILVSKSLQNPMMIDPQLQASKWIKNMLKKQGLVMLKIGNDNTLKHLQTALRMHHPIMLQMSEASLDPAIQPLLAKDYECTNNRYFVKVGENRIQVNPDLKIYVYTKLLNPVFAPDVFIKLCVINFTVTPQGLQDQLLADVVQNQLPQIQSKKRQLVSIISKGKNTLQKNQDKILQLLNNSSGNILDDEELIKNLKESKIVSTQVKISLQENVVKSKEIQQARSAYQPVAKRGASLYMIIAELTSLETMYQFSLQYFSRIFKFVLTNTPENEVLQQRINALKLQLNKIIYTNISRGLFNQHKKIFAFMMAVKIQNIPKPEYEYFLKGNFSLTKEIEKPTKLIPNVTHETSQSLFNLKQLFQSEIYEFLTKSPDKITQFNQKPLTYFHQSKIDNLTAFQHLLITKVLRPQLTVDAITQFIQKILGSYFVQEHPSTMIKLYQDINNKIPLIFILSVGADPLQSLLRLAKQLKQEEIATISLGQGQQTPSIRALQSQSKNGGWVILQNCHLSKSFMPRLQKKVEQLNEDKQMHKDFRLFLTSMPCNYFPSTILQNSLKVTSQPPRGLKANLKKILNNATFKQSDEQKTLTFNLCYFHAIVLERRKFGSLGWNILYDFNESDLETSLTIVNNLLQVYDDIPWDAIQYFIGEIVYGGRITDDFDRRLLKTVLISFISPESVEKPLVKPGDIQVYKNFIDSLGEKDDPEIFGMHSNAQITYLNKIAHEALESIMLLQPQKVSQGDTEKTLSMVQNLLKKIPAILKSAKEQKQLDAIDICLQQQSNRFNNLIIFIEKNLKQLIQAVKGEAIMTQSLQLVFISLTNNQVPKSWEKKAYPSLKPLSSWFQDLISRITFFRHSLHQKPKLYWISAFFFPQGFLTSVLQIYGRKNKFPVDKLGFNFIFKHSTQKQFNEGAPSQGCLIYGLYSQACCIDFKTSTLKQSSVGSIDSEVPIIHFKPVQAKVESNSGIYMAPLYKTKKRAGTLSTTGHSTNYIISIACKSDYDEGFWTKRGAALFCSLEN